MRGERSAAAMAAVAIVLAIVAGVVITFPKRPIPTISLTGVVLRQDTDVRRQMPIENVQITAAIGLASVETKSDSSGFFQFTLHPIREPNQHPPISLTFRHPSYHLLELTLPDTAQMYIARMKPLSNGESTHVEANSPQVVISNVRLRYTTKATVTMSVGGDFKIFEVANTGGIPCNGHPPCSPDGKWRAATGSISLDAGEGNRFSNVRTSCIAGPCPFTKIQSDQSANVGRTLKVTALNWSDTATFLVEAEVTHVTVTDLVRQSYPVKIGNGMNFALPATAVGPSIEAELNRSEIVFPLGPDLQLSWATCSVKVDADRSSLYSCELKPGFRFAQ